MGGRLYGFCVSACASRGTGNREWTLIETTRLADPASVIQSLFVDETMRSQTELDAVVTVVDAKHILAHWESSEAQEHMACADVIIRNKIDLIPQPQREAMEQRIRDMNSLVRPAGKTRCYRRDELSEAQLAALVTPEAMMGVARVEVPAST